MNDKKYPHWMQTKESMQKSTGNFVGFYIPNLDIQEIKTQFPNGCDDHVNMYSVYLNDLTIIEHIYNKTLAKSAERKQILNTVNGIFRDNPLLWEFSDLLHKGYRPIFDKNFSLLCCKGKIVSNKHTKIILLKTVPKAILDLWKRILNEVIKPTQEIIINLPNEAIK